jgi:hypothetical protein
MITATEKALLLFGDCTTRFNTSVSMDVFQSLVVLRADATDHRTPKSKPDDK